MRLRVCIQCGNPRRSLNNEICSRCRKHPHDNCPRCGKSKLVNAQICIRCHAKEASQINAMKTRGTGHGRFDSCACGTRKHRESKLCQRCHMVAMREAQLEKNPPLSKIIFDGRTYIYQPGYHLGPRSIYRSRVKLAWLIAEQIIGRSLASNEIVHHINGNKLDDRPENVQVVTVAEHIQIHKPWLSCQRQEV